MSNNNQTFVKTFSRRAQSTENQSVVASGTQQTTELEVKAGAEERITRVDQPEDVTLNRQLNTQQNEISKQPNQTAYVTEAFCIAGVTAPRQPITHESGNSVVDHPADLPSVATTGIPETKRFDPESHGPPTPHHRLGKNPDESRQVSTHSIEPFRAVWEVDVFDLPPNVADLFFDGKRFQQIAERMSEAVSAGLQSILITSSQSGEGRSSVAIGIAMSAAASGIRVALVDADTEKPTLADDLHLELQYGWVDTVRGGLPIKEIAVHAVEDGVTLIPLMSPNGQTAATSFEVTRLVDTLKSKFDLIVIDGPSSRSPNSFQVATAVDTAIIVRDVTRTDGKAVEEISFQMQQAGIRGVGVVENFVSAGPKPRT